MLDYPHVRASDVCPLYKRHKDRGLAACWSCYHALGLSVPVKEDPCIHAGMNFTPSEAPKRGEGGYVSQGRQMRNNGPITLTGRLGTNAELMPDVFHLYISEGQIVADVTYGRGVFWKNLDESKYNLLKSDLRTGVDFRSLPYEDDSIDALILDPPYMHGGATVKESINNCYHNENGSHESIVRLYTGGILEAARVLKKQGILLVKTQDEIESGKQKWTHIELIQLLEMLGFAIVDLFVLVQSSIPTMREKYQKSARKNHSYAIVARFRR